jgi:uncharacterized protein Yka (UPF0111/DUF47 family)
MFSLQRTLGRDDEFCALFEASAREAVNSVETLRTALGNESSPPRLEGFVQSRRRDKEITRQISDLLIHALVVSLQREDIEELAEALYKIPKTVEKFAERYLISYKQIGQFDFTRQLVLMEEATKSIFEMMQAFRANAGVAEIKRLDARIQRLENNADDVILDLIEKLYEAAFPSLTAIILKDLIELNEKVVDRCRDASGVIARIVIKNA